MSAANPPVSVRVSPNERDLLDHRIVTIAAADWERFEAWAQAARQADPGLAGAVEHPASMAGLTPPRPLTGDDDRETFDCGRD